jgi:hypothetical protein
MAGLIKTLALILGIVIAAIFVAGLALGGLRIGSGSTSREDTMVSGTRGPLAQTAIPPMNAAPPAKTETATFALG